MSAREGSSGDPELVAYCKQKYLLIGAAIGVVSTVLVGLCYFLR